MSYPFHYIVQSKLIRSSESNTQNLIEFEKSFEHEEPIKAREQAFNHYQSYIDVLLEAKGKKYISDIQARKELYPHIDSGTAQVFSNNKLKLNFNDDYDKGISIYLVVDKAVQTDELEVSVGEHYLVHSFEHFDKNDLSVLINGLLTEFELFKQFEFAPEGYNSMVDFSRIGFPECGCKSILRTPFDWSKWNEILGVK